MNAPLPALAPFDPATMIQTVDRAGHGLRVVFYKRGDRWGHVVAAVSGEHVSPLLVSVEGTNEQVWPPSPPLQSLSIEQRATGAVALLVGMAGRSHWSASVASIPNAASQTYGFEFDLACKASGGESQLGSQYKILTDATDSWSFDFPADFGSQCTQSGNLISLRPVSSSTQSHRWRHRILSP